MDAKCCLTYFVQGNHKLTRNLIFEMWHYFSCWYLGSISNLVIFSILEFDLGVHVLLDREVGSFCLCLSPSLIFLGLEHYQFGLLLYLIFWIQLLEGLSFLFMIDIPDEQYRFWYLKYILNILPSSCSSLEILPFKQTEKFPLITSRQQEPVSTSFVCSLESFLSFDPNYLYQLSFCDSLEILYR